MLKKLFLMLALAVALLLPEAAYANPTGHPNPVDFTDSSSNPQHLYTQGSDIGFTIESFGAAYESGMTCTLVFGIMERDSNSFWEGKVLSNTSSMNGGYGLQMKPDSQGKFTISSSINTDSTAKFPKGILAVKVYNDKGELLHSDDGIPAYIPIVDKGDNPAIIMDASHQEGYEDQSSTSPFHITDPDVDHVYFAGNELAVEFDMGSLAAGDQLLNLLEGQSMKIYFGLYSSEASPLDTQVKLLEELQKDSTGYYAQGVISGGKVRASGHLCQGIPTGIAGAKAVLPQMMGSSEIATPLKSADDKFAVVGISEALLQGIEISPSLSQIKNYYNVESALTFTKQGCGRVIFQPGINMLDYKDQLSSMDSSIRVDYDPASSQISYEVMTDKLGFLEDVDASIEIFDLEEKVQKEIASREEAIKQLQFDVYDGGPGPVPDSSEYIKYDYLSYSDETGSLIMPVEHFTKYVIGLKSDSGEGQKPDDSLYTQIRPGEAAIAAPSKVWTVKLSGEPLEGSMQQSISIYRVDGGNAEKIETTALKDSTNPNQILIEHSKPFESGNYMIYIEGSLKSNDGRSLSKPVRMGFEVK